MVVVSRFKVYSIVIVCVMFIYKDHQHICLIHTICTLYGPQRKKTCLRGFVNNKAADQPAHMRSLISPFVVRLTESIMS